MKKIIFAGGIVLCFFSGVYSQDHTDTLAPVKVKTEQFDVNVATEEYLNMLTPEQRSKSDEYFEGGYWIMLWEFVIEIFIAWIFLSLGLSKWIMRLASGAKNINLKNLIYILLYLLVAYLISFPYTVYTGFLREHQYGLSNMTFGGWLSEELISLLLLLVLGGILIMSIYLVLRNKAEQWWIWGSGVVIVFLIFLLFISPVFISPLFNDYKPLADGPVKEEILSLARANGVPVERVYQFDASKQSTRISANVNGIGNVIRISLNDNLLNKCTLAEIKSVMAHEMGHYILNHTYELLIYFGLIVIIGFAFVNFILRKLIVRFGPRWGINSISDIRSLPLFVLIFSFYVFIATPIINNTIRIDECEADIFGLNAAREPDGFASVAMKLSEYRKISPGRLEEIIFYDHPSGKVRVLSAMRWKAENLKKTELQGK